MKNKAKLYLIPNVISDNTAANIVTPQLREILPGITHFLAENIRTARRYLSSIKVYDAIEPLQFSVLNKDTVQAELPQLMQPLLDGFSMGVISESGCPGIADPGAVAVLWAHKNHIQVVPLVGPSSILMALMSSGLNGQKFAFHGYLPIDAKDAAAEIKFLERESKTKNQTQIFIETPYRNNGVLATLINTLHVETLLTVAMDVTGVEEFIVTKSVKEWKVTKTQLGKVPAVFLFLAEATTFPR